MMARRVKPRPSALVARQRELSWAMYVVEGCVANLYHIQAVNSATMRRSDLRIIRDAIRDVETISRSLHAAMADDVDADAGEAARRERREQRLEER